MSATPSAAPGRAARSDGSRRSPGCAGSLRSAAGRHQTTVGVSGAEWRVTRRESPGRRAVTSMRRWQYTSRTCPLFRVIAVRRLGPHRQRGTCPGSVGQCRPPHSRLRSPARAEREVGRCSRGAAGYIHEGVPSLRRCPLDLVSSSPPRTRCRIYFSSGPLRPPPYAARRPAARARRTGSCSLPGARCW